MVRSALPGQRFGRLVVLEVVEGRKRMCLCDCGAETVVSACNLQTGNTQSCGCLRREIEKVAAITHGGSSGGSWSRAYITWHGMKQRCLNPRNPSYSRYGGRGITICPAWLESFENFLSDMGEPPDGLSLERVDNNGPYSKENCVWATPTRQNRNKRSNRLLTYQGETKPLAQWSEDLGIPYFTLHARLRRGWSTEKTLATEVNRV